MPIVFRFVLRKVLKHVKQVVQSGLVAPLIFNYNIQIILMDVHLMGGNQSCEIQMDETQNIQYGSDDIAWKLLKCSLTCTKSDHTSSFKLSKSACVLDKAMTSAPHSTNILAVLRPIPLNEKHNRVFLQLFRFQREKDYKNYKV